MLPKHRGIRLTLPQCNSRYCFRKTPRQVTRRLIQSRRLSDAMPGTNAPTGMSAAILACTRWPQTIPPNYGRGPVGKGQAAAGDTGAAAPVATGAAPEPGVTETLLTAFFAGFFVTGFDVLTAFLTAFFGAAFLAGLLATFFFGATADLAGLAGAFFTLLFFLQQPSSLLVLS